MTTPTDARRDEMAKAIYCNQHAIMHDHDACWQAEKQLRGAVWLDVADAALSVADRTSDAAQEVKEAAVQAALNTPTRALSGFEVREQIIKAISAISISPREAGAEGEALLPCDVLIAPVTVLRAGCKISTLLNSIERRRGMTIAPISPEKVKEFRAFLDNPLSAPPAMPTCAEAEGRWKRCPSTHCERRQECASPNDCTVKSPSPPSPSKPDDEAINRALVAWYENDESWATNEDEWANKICSDMRAAITAYHLARFGGDPGEMIDSLAKHQQTQAATFQTVSEIRKERYAARIAELEREGSELSANQCHHGYAGEHGHHICKYQDRIADLEAQVAAAARALDSIRSGDIREAAEVALAALQPGSET